MKDIASILFNKKKDKNQFNIENEKLKELKSKLDSCNNRLFDLIADKVKEEHQNKFNEIIFEAEELVKQLSEIENEEYYKFGVEDGMNLAETLENK